MKIRATLLALVAGFAFVGQAIANTCKLRQSDAVELPIGQFVDATDGVTAETGLTISQADVQLKKCAAAGDCGAMAQKNDSSACAHDALGVYECDFDATDTNTVGTLFIYVNESGALTEKLVCQVLEEAVFDQDYAASATGNRPATVTAVNAGAIDNADFATAPGAAGGLLIAGTNADFDVTANSAFAGGLTITQSTSNASALVITGNGTGHGAAITSGSGATGNGIHAVAASTNGNGINAAGTGTGSGVIGTGGATGDGLEGVGGSTSGNGVRAAGTAGNSAAMNLVGQGSAAGLLTTGGATGAGLSAVGGSTSGAGISAAGTAGNSTAMNLAGQGSASGLTSTGGATGHGISAVGGATSGSGLRAVASTSGNGIIATGVGTTQAGIAATGGSTSSAGISAAGGGTGAGLLTTGGATGHGFLAAGGATSGNGIATTVVAPSAAAPEFGITASGTLSGTHSSTTADLGTNAPGTVSDAVGLTVFFPTRHLSRAITSYDTATGIATFAAIDADITLTNADPWFLFGTAPGSGGGGATAAEVADAVWDEDMTAHQAQGSAGQVLGDSAADSDSIWALVNTNVNATISSRASQTSVDTVDDFIDTEIGTLTTRLGTPSDLGGGASVAANLADIEGQTDDIGAAGAGLTAADDAVMTRLGAPVGASLSADIAAVESGISWNSAWDAEVESEVDDALGSGTGTALTAIPWNSAWDAEVQSEANDAIVANELDHLFLTTYDPASKPGAADALLNELVENDGGVARYTANALEQGPAGGGGSSNVTQIEGSDATDVIDARIAAAGLATASALTTHDNKLGTPSNLGGGATLAANLADIEAQTDDIGAAGAGLTAADDAVITAVDAVPTNAELATALGTADDAVLAAIAALNNLTAEQVWSYNVEDQGGGISARCALAVALAGIMGDVATSGQNSTYEEASGTETRATTIIVSSGNRTATITCPTY
jgi:hypothetical protein